MPHRRSGQPSNISMEKGFHFRDVYKDVCQALIEIEASPVSILDILKYINLWYTVLYKIA